MDFHVHPPSIPIAKTELKKVEDFKYLGSIISNDGTVDKKINARICKVSQGLGQLRVPPGLAYPMVLCK